MNMIMFVIIVGCRYLNGVLVALKRNTALAAVAVAFVAGSYTASAGQPPGLTVTLGVVLSNDEPVVVSIPEGRLTTYRSYRHDGYRVGLIPRLGEDGAVDVEIVEVSGRREAPRPGARRAAIHVNVGDRAVTSEHESLPLVVGVLALTSEARRDEGVCTLSCGDAEVTGSAVIARCGACSAR